MHPLESLDGTMRLHSLGLLSAALSVARAANFTVAVDGAASHPMPETLCEYQPTNAACCIL